MVRVRIEILRVCSPKPPKAVERIAGYLHAYGPDHACIPRAASQQLVYTGDTVA